MALLDILLGKNRPGSFQEYIDNPLTQAGFAILGADPEETTGQALLKGLQAAGRATGAKSKREAELEELTAKREDRARRAKRLLLEEKEFGLKESQDKRKIKKELEDLELKRGAVMDMINLGILPLEQFDIGLDQPKFIETLLKESVPKRERVHRSIRETMPTTPTVQGLPIPPPKEQISSEDLSRAEAILANPNVSDSVKQKILEKLGR